MTDDQIRIAIAECLGWKWAPPEKLIHPNKLAWWKQFPDHPDEILRDLLSPLDDWPNDLNAMHEAEKTLSKSEIKSYVSHLLQGWSTYYAATATARQRAEAFLRVKGKWEPDSEIPTKQEGL